jgi:hypothetical protein
MLYQGTRRLPGEKFADFAARQKAEQIEAKAQHDSEIKSQRAMRKSRKVRERSPTLTIA